MFYCIVHGVNHISHGKLTICEHVRVLAMFFPQTTSLHNTIYFIFSAVNGLCFFAAVGPPIVFPFLYNSYPEQHRDEIMKLFEVIETMDVPVLMGDFNHGSASPGQGFDCMSCLSVEHQSRNLVVLSALGGSGGI